MHLPCASSFTVNDTWAILKAVIQTASAIGPMFSGFLQTVGDTRLSGICKSSLILSVFVQAAYNGLNGVHGLAGWKCPSLVPRFHRG